MKSKNTTGKAFMLSFFAYCAFSINLTPVSEERKVHFLIHYISHFNGFSIAGAFLFLGLFLYFQRTMPAVHSEKMSFCGPEMILSALFSIFILVGISFERTNTGSLLYGPPNGQILITVTKLAGYFIVFFYGITYLFRCWNQYSAEERVPCSNTERERSIYSHPFIFVFAVLFIAYLPRAVISFPAIVMGDTPWQISQAFPGLSYSHVARTVMETDPAQYVTPQSKLLSENVFINMHHPVVHTLLMHACICLGHTVFRSWNAGLYIYTLLQGTAFLAAVSYSIAIIVREKVIPAKYIYAMTAYFFIHPHIHSYLFLATKDVFYSAFFVLFMTHWFLLLRGSCKKKDICILVISAMGMLLFRNEARFILPVFLAVSGLINKSVRKTAGALTGIVIVFNLLVFKILFPALNYSPGSTREMLSVPFQQTARYVHYYEDEVTEQERNVIDRVLDYDSLSEKYDPYKSDPVKNTYRNTVDSDDLIQYFKCWIRMFFKHPKTYFSATINNYYEYVYPSSAKARQYTYSWSDTVLKNANIILKPIGVEFSHPAQFDHIRYTSDEVIRVITRFPFISLIMTPACYVWVILLILFFSIKTKTKQLSSLIALPFLVILVCFLGPTNGGYGGRYLLPVIVFMPILIPMAAALTKHT